MREGTGQLSRHRLPGRCRGAFAFTATNPQRDEPGEPHPPTRETLSTLRPHFGSLRGCWPRIVEEE